MAADPVAVRYLKDKASGPPAAAPATVLGLWPDYMQAGEDMMSIMTASSTSIEGSTVSSVKTGDARNNCQSYQDAIDQLIGTLSDDYGVNLDRWTRWSRT